MSVYTMTLHRCDGSVSKVGAAAYKTLDEAHAGAIALARSIMTDEIRHGRLCLTCWIVVTNERGHTMMTVPFGEAGELLDHPACNGAPAAGAIRQAR